MAHRFGNDGLTVIRFCQNIVKRQDGVNYAPRFTGKIITHPERLSIPLKRRKPTMYAVWNDLFHEAVSTQFIDDALEVMAACPRHTFLILTKRAHLMEEKIYGVTEEHGCRELGGGDYLPNVWHGLTVCNQQEWNEKGPIFMQVPGLKFISHEPALERIDYHLSGSIKDVAWRRTHGGSYERSFIAGLIAGGETGSGARPSHPDIFRIDRDQCAAGGVPFFFKGWGAYGVNYLIDDDMSMIPGSEWMDKGVKPSGRLLDGREHNELPWRE